MRNRTFALAACILAGAVAACGEARPALERGGAAAAADCTACHGGLGDDTGAPPRDLNGRTATTEVTVGAHATHVKAGPLAAAFDCDACHVKPASIGAPGHLDPSQKIVWGTLASAGGASPSWDRASATCSNVYCHGATLVGGTIVTPRWTAVDGSQAACGTCHGLPPSNHPVLAAGSTAATCSACHPETVKPDGSIDASAGRHVNGAVDGFAGHPPGWMDAASPAFHGPVARPDTAACEACHAVAPPARVTTVVCTTCHDQAGSGDFTLRCNSCHGSAASFAPPRDLSGNTATTAVGVGAHQSHLLGTHAFAAPLDCTSCHPAPGAVATPGHMDGQVQVTGYTGTDPDLVASVRAPGWSPGPASCATSYCHGASSLLGGGAVAAPVWTRVDGSQVFCGSCHGLPPTDHPALAAGSDRTTCAACHDGTARPDGTIDVAAGRHLNGRADGFAGHPAGWTTKGDPAFHGLAVLQGVDACLGCHAAKAPARVSAVTCASCHDALSGGGDWTTSCIGCHGSDTTSSPPEDAHGNTATTAIGVGAHRSHVDGASGIARRYDCSTCHEKPAVVFSPGHLDGTTKVTGYTGADPGLQFVKDPGWNRANVTCSTSWCHGAYSGTYTYFTEDGAGTEVQVDFAYAGRHATPRWTQVDGTQAACGTCHGAPPSPSGSWHSGSHGGAAGGAFNACSLCHPGVDATGAGFTDASRHVNGVVDVMPAWEGRCFNCH